MKPQNWEFLTCRPIRVISLSAAFFFSLTFFLTFFPTLSAFAQNAPDQRVIRIRMAEFIISDSPAPPPHDAGWQQVTLPHHVPKPTNQELVFYWYKANFTESNLAEPQWILFPQLLSGGDVYVNGHLIGTQPWSNEQIQVRWYVPALWLIPPAVMRGGMNEIEVRLAIREPFTSFGEIEVGPEKVQRDTFNFLYFWEDTTADISTALCILVGICIFVFWLRRPQEKLYGLFGVCVMFWGLRTLLLRTPVVAMDYFLLWRLAYYFCTAGFIVLISIFMIRFAGRNYPVYNRVLVAYWLAGCAMFSIYGMSIRHFLEAYWLSGFLPLNLYAVFCILVFAQRKRTHHAVSMGLAILFALGLSIHDLAVQEAWVDWPEIYLMHLGLPAFLLVMLTMLMERFLDSLSQVESINEQLELRVAARESELKLSYDQLRKLERLHAATEERHRIVQDMHDGVGTQLLSTLMVAQQTELSQETLVALLQECLDDMRLVIDSLSPDDRDLLPVLGNFRFRMESRFRAIGLEFEWFNYAMPDSLEMDPDVGLQVLRILQESLANILKHAKAKKVAVELFFEPDRLCIRVKDDGCGFDENAKVTRVGTGRGVVNMRERARKIGAELNLKQLSPGTEVILDVALTTP